MGLVLEGVFVTFGILESPITYGTCSRGCFCNIWNFGESHNLWDSHPATAASAVSLPSLPPPSLPPCPLQSCPCFAYHCAFFSINLTHYDRPIEDARKAICVSWSTLETKKCKISMRFASPDSQLSYRLSNYCTAKDFWKSSQASMFQNSLSLRAQRKKVNPHPLRVQHLTLLCRMVHNRQQPR